MHFSSQGKLLSSLLRTHSHSAIMHWNLYCQEHSTLFHGHRESNQRTRHEETTDTAGPAQDITPRHSLSPPMPSPGQRRASPRGNGSSSHNDGSRH
ncbi:hypothetical protein E2C01_050350 [Portunus trituberculatus]|uniref:Uncharacterized protein n=1 Tax=Portunus trituberculatus TaxID=210409 RepID=A0A5B7G813_PORTR|nr:hypothetical protein [Portunus trituberculatus]